MSAIVSLAYLQLGARRCTSAPTRRSASRASASWSARRPPWSRAASARRARRRCSTACTFSRAPRSSPTLRSSAASRHTSERDRSAIGARIPARPIGTAHAYLELGTQIRRSGGCRVRQIARRLSRRRIVRARWRRSARCSRRLRGDASGMRAGLGAIAARWPLRQRRPAAQCQALALLRYDCGPDGRGRRAMTSCSMLQRRRPSEARRLAAELGRPSAVGGPGGCRRGAGGASPAATTRSR